MPIYVFRLLCFGLLQFRLLSFRLLNVYTSICSSESYTTQILMCYEIYHVPERNASMKSKNFDFGICTSYDVSGCSLKEYL